MTHPGTTPKELMTTVMYINSTDDEFTKKVLVSDEVLLMIRYVNWGVFCGSISLFGIVSNLINIAVFYKTGFKDTITLSFFALVIADFGSCFSSLLIPILLLGVGNSDMAYILGSWPHVAFAKVTTLITAFITVERCLCVSMPLKVKTIVTHKRAIVYLVFSFVLILATVVPIINSHRLRWKFDPNKNKEMLKLVILNKQDTLTRIFNVILSFAGFFFLISATILLVVKLKQSAKFRLEASTAAKSKGENVETKEQKISKMVAIIATLFNICFLPTAAFQLAKWIDRERVNIYGEYKNVVGVVSSTVFTIETFNSAINIVIYYRNSSNYKAMFDQMFRSRKI